SFRCLDREEAADTVLRTLQVRQPYVLYVGNLKPHKNVLVLLRAFAILNKRFGAQLQLVILGDDKNYAESLVDESTSLGISHMTHFIPQVPRPLLAKLYAAAGVLVMPSRVEGFGLPALEAMASGTPVICSHAASLPEVAGNAALYFDPFNEEELAVQIERVLESHDLQNELRKKGFLRAEQLT